MDEVETTPAVMFGVAGDGRPRLELLRSPMVAAVGRNFLLSQQPTIIGRAQGADLRIDDTGISRRHARVVPQAGGFELQDLGPTNGTFVNGRRVTRAVLREGDRVQVGSMTLLRFTSARDNRRSASVGRALAAAGVGIWEWSVAQRRLSGSPNLDRVLGLSPDDLEGPPERLLALLGALQRQELTNKAQQLLGGAPRSDLELRIDSPSGTRWVGLQAEVLRDEDGTPLFIAGTAVDLTARKTAESELRRQAHVFESLYDAVVLCDLGGRITEWNASAESVFRKLRSEVLGRELGEVLAIPTQGEQFLRALSTEGRWSGEVIANAAGAGQRVLEAVAVPLRDVDGRPMAHMVAFRDVSERKRIEGRLLLADRMASVGTLAAGVAHEINNPLAFINANLGYLADQVEHAADSLSQVLGAELGEVRQVLTETQEGVRRIEMIVRDLKTFSRADDRGEVEPVNLRRMLNFAIKMVENQVRHRAQLEVDVGDGLWVRGNEARLSQVFVNLLVNASHAIPDGAAHSHAIRVRAGGDGGGFVNVEVQDTGAGMTPEVRARIFSPFFTTKKVGQGTGLGLSVSHAIVTALGGEIAVESEPGRGSTFRVRLPTARDPESPPTPVPVGPQPSRRRATVLVVDDDALVASALSRSLASHHDVVAVRSGREALALLESRPFDVVLCDLMMPDLGGMDLHALLSQQHPEMVPRLVFVTGGAFTPRAEAFVASVHNPVVRKPFTTTELLQVVEQTLARFGPAHRIATRLAS